MLSPRKGMPSMPSPRLNAAEFRKRFLSQFQDPSFEPLASELDKIAAAAWDAYEQPSQEPAHGLSVDWLKARAAIANAQRRYEERSTPAILLINCSSRSEHTCRNPIAWSRSREVFAVLHRTSRSRCST